jgi:hypothetical protein
MNSTKLCMINLGQYFYELHTMLQVVSIVNNRVQALVQRNQSKTNCQVEHHFCSNYDIFSASQVK